MLHRIARWQMRALVCACVTTLGGWVCAIPAARADNVPTSAPVALEWEPCAELAGAECTTLEVPLDYAHPRGKTIEIALSRVPATDPTRRISSLLVNPGGPGGSGRSLAVALHDSLAAGSPSAREVAARFDLIGFDPRGTGASSAVDCGDLSGIDQADYTPDDASERAALAKTMRAFADACATRTGPLLGFVDTASAARDMDRIRKALGDKKMTYLGFSYGTQLGASYADLFPRHVRAAVLDGAIDPGVNAAGLVNDQAASIEQLFDTLAGECAASPECAAKFPEGLGAVVDRVARAVDTAPLPDTATPGRIVSEGQIVTALGSALFGLPGVAGLIEGAISQADAGDGTSAAVGFDLYAEIEGDQRSNFSAATVAINCLDYRWPKGRAGIGRVIEQAERVAPRFGQTFLREFLPCAYWRLKPRPSRTTVAAGAPPILVVGTTGDPATPYRWAEAMAKQLRSGSLLTREGQGHTAYGRGSSCIDEAVNSYLLDLTLPLEGTICPTG